MWGLLSIDNIFDDTTQIFNKVMALGKGGKGGSSGSKKAESDTSSAIE